MQIPDVSDADSELAKTADSELAKTAAALESKFGVDVKCAMRFSKARKGHLAKAEAFLEADLKWRKEFQPDTIRQENIPNSLPSGNWRVVGAADGTGFPVLFINLALWNPNDYDVEEYGRYAAYFLEHMCKMGERFIVVFDMKGWKLSHGFHMRKIKRLITTLQDHYPERLERALLFRAPGIFAGAWAVIKGFVDPDTAEKIKFVTLLNEESSALREVGAWAKMPKIYGGGCTEKVPVPNLPGEPNVDECPDVDGSRGPVIVK